MTVPTTTHKDINMDSISNYSARDRRAIAGAIMAGRFEQTDDGMFVPALGGLTLGGRYTAIVSCEGQEIERSNTFNLIPNEGLGYALDVLLHSGTAKPSNWYAAPFEGNYTPVATVTAATIVAAATECTAYSESTRVAYTAAASASQVSSNSASLANFTFNATKTIYGAFITTTATKSATTGKLLSAARFSTSHAVQSGYVLSLGYDLTAASA